jgi:NADH-quinone oxidoreductase subunit M
MMWLFQRVVFGRESGSLPDPGDTQLMPSEVAELAAAGGGHGGHGHDNHGHAPSPVAGGDHGHGEANADFYPTHEGQLDSSRWPDLKPAEWITLVPLAALTIFIGVYPKPVFDIMGPSLDRILQAFQMATGG